MKRNVWKSPHVKTPSRLFKAFFTIVTANSAAPFLWDISAVWIMLSSFLFTLRPVQLVQTSVELFQCRFGPYKAVPGSDHSFLGCLLSEVNLWYTRRNPSDDLSLTTSGPNWSMVVNINSELINSAARPVHFGGSLSMNC